MAIKAYFRKIENRPLEKYMSKLIHKTVLIAKRRQKIAVKQNRMCITIRPLQDP